MEPAGSGFNPLPGLVVLLAAILTGIAFNRFGGRQGRYYAMPVTGGILILGLDWWYDIPLAAYLAGIVVAPFLFHRTIKQRLEKAARAIKELEVPELGVRLKRIPDPSGTHVAVWRAEDIPRDQGPREGLSRGPIVAAADGVDLAQQQAGAHTLILVLDFIGEMEDDYQVVLWGEAPKPMKEGLMLFHREAMGYFTTILGGEEPLTSIPGAEDWMTVRAKPQGLAYHLLDYRSFALLHELFRLRSETREMYVQVDGRVVRVGATNTFDGKELLDLMRTAAPWIQKVREASWTYAPPEEA